MLLLRLKLRAAAGGAEEAAVGATQNAIKCIYTEIYCLTLNAKP